MSSDYICNLCDSTKEESEVCIMKCNHLFCWTCVNTYLQQNLCVKIKCPIKNCFNFFRDSLIRRILNEEYIIKYENICINKVEKIHKCLLTECSHSIVYVDEDLQYPCPSCTIYNCVSCKAPHNYKTCSQFQELGNEEKAIVCNEEIRRAKYVEYKNMMNNNRKSLLSFEELDILPNDSVFTCSLCTLAVCKSDGIKLRNCLHNFCKPCLNEFIKMTNKIPVECPSFNCGNYISDREIQSVLSSDELKNFLNKCNHVSKKQFQNTFQCQTPNCDAFYQWTDKLKIFKCRSCKAKNCTDCKTIHPKKETCEDYLQKMKNDCVTNSINIKLEEGKLIRCPNCKSLLEKIRGCNWVQCQNCLLEICWILKIPRWGPKGRGDNTGGCRCGVDGKRCDPKCTSTCRPHY